MGRLVKNHWARLIAIAAGCVHVLAAIQAYFWPKIFFDWLTKNLDGAIKPYPILQTINLVLGFGTIALEWPLEVIARRPTHQSIPLRLFLYPLHALAAALIFQGMDAAAYYLITTAVYFWAYVEGEVICPVPWQVPRSTGKSA